MIGSGQETPRPEVGVYRSIGPLQRRFGKWRAERWGYRVDFEFRVLFVVHILFEGEHIRTISARRAGAHVRKLYEDGNDQGTARGRPPDGIDHYA